MTSPEFDQATNTYLTNQSLALADFLLKPTNSGYSQTDSPIMQMVKARITTMARDIATEIVNENLALRERVTTQVRKTVEQLLRDDTYTNQVVVDAVAKALGQLRADGSTIDE